MSADKISMTPGEEGEIICGIDPGFARLGYAFIRRARTPEVIEADCFETKPGRAQPERIAELMEKLAARLKTHRPKYVALERLFFSKNQKTALKVSETRGAIMMLASSLGLSIKEYSPSEIKLAIAGNGAADKKAVKKMVELTLKVRDISGPDDVTDALAVALSALYDRT